LKTVTQHIEDEINTGLKVEYFRGNLFERNAFENLLNEHGIMISDIYQVFKSMFGSTWSVNGVLKDLKFELGKDILEMTYASLFFCKNRKVYPVSTVKVYEIRKTKTICLNCFEELFAVFLLVFKEGCEYNSQR
jgi:hypothetical protein